MDLGESTLERREFLAVGGATIAATAVGSSDGVDRLDRTLPDERAQAALSEVEAMTFDVFRSLSTRMRHLGESIREQSPV